ncbi:hypothetical protein [Streptomyces sp. ME19-01-6]|uniref:hypothetical protein n=1 Tax=Streptomyces sp. ME19-01-6 TaxID=3028686 RepID=UPI0029A4D0D3|nr:hypothetical protein [Streptomyces sp. ME19-01-6]MDX3230823.1 hypothetical protein [Streptomyces sp. ME19-01-6]
MGRVRAGALVLMLALGGVACGGGGGSSEEPPAEKRLKARKSEGDGEVGPKHPKVQVAYPYDLYSHCGIEWADFGGKTWKISGGGPSISTRVEGDAPEGGNATPGYMTLLSKDEAVFEAADFPPVYFKATMETPPPCK